jgi:hypothetical protein
VYAALMRWSAAWSSSTAPTCCGTECPPQSLWKGGGERRTHQAFVRPGRPPSAAGSSTVTTKNRRPVANRPT